METATLQTVGQLEREISQKMQAAYKQNLGHRPSKVSCQLFDSRVVIVLEDSITQPEKLLAAGGKTALVEQVRSDLNKALQSPVKELIESVLDVIVLDVLSSATIETGHTSIIATLSKTPAVRNPTALTEAP